MYHLAFRIGLRRAARLFSCCNLIRFAPAPIVGSVKAVRACSSCASRTVGVMYARARPAAGFRNRHCAVLLPSGFVKISSNQLIFDKQGVFSSISPIFTDDFAFSLALLKAIQYNVKCSMRQSQEEVRKRVYQILKKQTLNANTKLMVIEAPHVARKAEPGQFIILRVSAEGERIPLTIADFDREKGFRHDHFPGRSAQRRWRSAS